MAVKQANGSAYGPGVYSSLCPSYAQLYAPVERWRGYFVQTMLMLRQPARDILAYRDEGSATRYIKHRNDLWRLYGGIFNPGELQMKTNQYKNIVIQAILVKVHDVDPTQSGGEYERVCQLLGQLT
jgi:hypothetical protein